MRRLYIFIILTISVLTANAQEYRDVVYLKNGSVIKGFYEEIYADDTLRMKTLDGSMLVCPMTDVLRIAKERTDVYVIKQEKEVIVDKWRPRGYSGSFEILNSKDVEKRKLAEYGIYTTHGYRFNRNLFLGAGLGVSRYTFSTNNLNIQFNSITIPLFLETRFYVLRTRIAPVISCRGGYSVSGLKGWFVDPSVGADFGISPRSAGFVRLAYRLQWHHFNASVVGVTEIEEITGQANYILLTGGIRF